MLNPVSLLIKYKYIITILVFSVWMLFFDGNSVMFMNKQNNELLDLRAQEDFLKAEIVDMKDMKINLFSDDNKLERFARENYFFKKDNEDVYVIEKAED
ncbi:septum formation initiator family protein [Bacteroidia bacterium]|nr:septum formation initiator family protein [Bacteroidia bacterium]MDC1395071.1 septum formation initiator family protein [Bacteroidia bacterium]